MEHVLYGERMGRRVGFVPAVLLLVVLSGLSACSSLSDRVDMGVPGVEGRWVEVVGSGASLDAGLVRRALVAAPSDVVPRQQNLLGVDEAEGAGGLPLVVAIHGLGGSPEVMAYLSGWPSVVATDRVVVVFPEGWEASFNAGECCGPAAEQGVDDVSFLDDVIDATASLYPVDRDRVFMSGFSNGGMVTYRYLCEHADRLAGAASITGTNVDGCAPSAPVSFLQISGRIDEVVPPDGGPSVTPGIGPFGSAFTSTAAVAAASGCAEERTRTFVEVEATRWSECTDDVRVEYQLTPFGHEWPATAEYSATVRQLEFWGLRPPP